MAMSTVLKAKLYTSSAFPFLTEGRVLSILEGASSQPLNSSEYVIFPGFCDVHVHFREPGFSYKETISSGCAAAAHGGYTVVCPMPNLKPVPDQYSHLKEELDCISAQSTIDVRPYGSITMEQKGVELADMPSMEPYVVAFSDDGKGIQSQSLMREAMLIAKSLGKTIVAHCEDNSLLKGGYIHDGQYAKTHSHKGICSESEWGPIARDVQLARETGCSYHVCHISCKESVEIIRQAKKEGVDVTCETAPHYLTMNDSMLQEDGRFKMNPPLRSEEDRLALLQGLQDGTIDMIATDHAPHSLEEKSKGLRDSSFGIVGLETAFPVLYTDLVKTGLISLEKLLELLTINPRKRFGIPTDDSFSVWNLKDEYTIQPGDFKSMGKSTPFSGKRVFGRCESTFYRGEKVW